MNDILTGSDVIERVTAAASAISDMFGPGRMYGGTLVLTRVAYEALRTSTIEMFAGDFPEPGVGKMLGFRRWTVVDELDHAAAIAIRFEVYA
jgi:hypothetical protein